MGKKSQDTTATTCLARALADGLRRRYPLHTISMVARDLDCTAKAAENLLNGHLSATSLARLIGTYGPGFVAEAVMAAAGTTLEHFIEQQAEEAGAAALRAEERAHELRILQAKLAASRGRDPGGDRPRA